MHEAILDYLGFITGLSPSRFFRLFWFFFLFDFSRYILWELLIVVHAVLRRKSRSVHYDLAHHKLRSDNPLVSVIVPGKNEGRHIPQLARSLRRQTWRHLEVIIVDDGSDDNTAEICRGLEQRGLIDLFLSNEIRGGKASAANLGMRFAKGKIVVHLDADSHLFVDAIENLLVPFYLDHSVGAVGGDIRVSNAHDTLPTALQAVEYSKSISIGRRVSSSLGILRIISGAFGAFRMDVLKRLKGWDVGPGLDGDITLKIRKLGFKVLYESNAVCFTHVPKTFKRLAKQRYRWDRSFVRFRLRKHRDLLTPQANFRFFNFLTVVDNTFYNFILNANWWIYFFDMVTNYSSIIWHVFLTNYLLYILSNVIQYTVTLVLAPNRVIRRMGYPMLVYLPLMPLYMGFFLRVIRTYAHINELVWRRSYEDKWNPWKVSRQVLSRKT